MGVIENPDTAAPLESAGVCPYPWTVETFYRALSAGLFEYPERLELIKGEILERMSPRAGRTITANPVLRIFCCWWSCRTARWRTIGA